VLSIFAVSVPIAAGFASFGDSLKFLGVIPFDDPGSLPDPKNADGYAARGVAYRSKGHFDRAIADHNKAIELEPGNGIRYNDRADAFVSKGNVDQAMADYTKAIELDPNIALPLNSRGRIYLDRGDIDRALADFTKAVELAWNDSDGFSNRATAYYNRGDIDQAIADLTKASELSPSNSGYLFSLGVAKYGKGYFKDAAADLGRSLEKRSYIYAMLFRYLARTRAGEPAEAELEANVGRLTDKKWPYAVAELYLGKRSPAATLDAGNGSDQRCEAQFYVGQWHVLKGNAADAAAAHKVAVDTCPKNFYEYRVAVAELKRLTR
jgi:tetratricopeptide (TPR) repeat protein